LGVSPTPGGAPGFESHHFPTVTHHSMGTLIVGLISLALFIYLLVAMLYPENF
jgi:K+-transporting ATPase KdpF subunit